MIKKGDKMDYFKQMKEWRVWFLMSFNLFLVSVLLYVFNDRIDHIPLLLAVFTILTYGEYNYYRARLASSPFNSPGGL